MKQCKTVKVKVLDHSSLFDSTLERYCLALEYCLKVCYQELELSYDESNLTTQHTIEMLIHATAKNPNPKYADFDVLFHKFPSYLRRACITSSYGKWQSWRSNYQIWEQERRKASIENQRFFKKAPTFQYEHKEFPVLYKGNMYKVENDTVSIKIFQRNDWVWQPITLKQVDLEKRGLSDWTVLNPKLVRKGKKYFLHFAYEKEIKLHKKAESDCRILSVDLGLTNTAVCAVMDCDGTVVARKFIKQAKEKDHFYHLTNQLKKAQHNTFGARCPRYWNKIRGIQNQLVNDTAHQILSFAKEHQVDTIVFEYLRFMTMPKGFRGAKRLRFKLHHWCKIAIQNKVEEMAHYEGLRISRVLAKGTSMYAYDGSGKVERTPRKDLCTFQTGKEYHADLNASYNIGARFFIRAILKPFSEMKELEIQAKVPVSLVRTEQTLATLISLNQVISANADFSVSAVS